MWVKAWALLQDLQIVFSASELVRRLQEEANHLGISHSPEMQIFSQKLLDHHTVGGEVSCECEQMYIKAISSMDEPANTTFKKVENFKTRLEFRVTQSMRMYN